MRKRTKFINSNCRWRNRKSGVVPLRELHIFRSEYQAEKKKLRSCNWQIDYARMGSILLNSSGNLLHLKTKTLYFWILPMLTQTTKFKNWENKNFVPSTRFHVLDDAFFYFLLLFMKLIFFKD